MKKNLAAKLHNRDQVEVRVDRDCWDNGYIVNGPMTVKDSKLLYFEVQTDNNGFLTVNHTDLR